MTDSDSNPKLPLWVYLATDAALLVAAFFIALQSKKPLAFNTSLLIVGCIFAGAIFMTMGLITHYERAKNETLDERQRALENLASTINASAEQISIAAAGLHEVAELAQKNLKHAEQLPHKLQDKIAEFQSLLANADASEKEELEKELVSLRESESERLEATATKIAKATAEFAKLEAATQQHLTAANEAIAKLSLGTAAAIGKAQAAAEQALAAARTEAAKGVGEAAGAAAKSIDSAKAAALADLNAAGNALVERVARELGALKPTSAAPAAPETPAPVAADAPANPDADAAKSETPAQPPKRPRKRRDETAPDEPAAAAAPAAPAEEDPSPKIQAVEEPAPIPVQKIPEVAPVAPHTAEPFAGDIEATAVPSSPALAAADAPKPPRKRAAKKPADTPTDVPADVPSEASAKEGAAAKEAKEDLGLDIDQTPKPTGEASERVLSSDGATRLLVTAYIGIGNRIFIRGAGPGLTWEKGIPLQFVSIGKWRWETNDATSAVAFKLYKNDDTECTALGAQKLDPGYQQEVTAAF